MKDMPQILSINLIWCRCLWAFKSGHQRNSFWKWVWITII